MNINQYLTTILHLATIIDDVCMNLIIFNLRFIVRYRFRFWRSNCLIGISIPYILWFIEVGLFVATL
ncbi:hypothetical protein BLOT_011316 [Blomia tropicalis]|nr:hypothetical protein BLOT_011316 [Blomia tropicalis]